MWFMFPPEADRISVQQQEFVTELKDKDGRGLFRAPAHFASLILALKGFAPVTDVPEGAPADLPIQDPLRDGAIHDLTGKITTLEGQVRSLTEDLASKDAAHKATLVERNQLIIQLQTANAKLKEYEEVHEDDEPEDAKTLE
jgi:hypothetical protein